MERDRQTLGLTAEGQAVLAQIMDLGWFADGQDVGRAALALAIRDGVAPGAAKETDTRWSAGNFDVTGEIRVLIAAMFPDSPAPVRLMEHFVNEGLKVMASRLSDPALTPERLLAADKASEA